MDTINLIRTAITVLALVAFLGIVWWAYSSSNLGRFEKAAQIPIEDD